MARRKELYGEAYDLAKKKVHELKAKDLIAMLELLYSGCPPCDQCRRLARFLQREIRAKEASHERRTDSQA